MGYSDELSACFQLLLKCINKLAISFPLNVFVSQLNYSFVWRQELSQGREPLDSGLSLLPVIQQQFCESKNVLK